MDKMICFTEKEFDKFIDDLLDKVDSKLNRFGSQSGNIVLTSRINDSFKQLIPTFAKKYIDEKNN